MEYLDPFEKKKGHVILFFFTTLALLKSENGVNNFLFFIFFSCMKLWKFAFWFSDFVLSLSRTPGVFVCGLSFLIIL